MYTFNRSMKRNEDSVCVCVEVGNLKSLCSCLAPPVSETQKHLFTTPTQNSTYLPVGRR